MDRGRDVRAVYPSPHSKQKMDEKPVPWTIHVLSHFTDRKRWPGFLSDGMSYGQRGADLPRGVLISADPRGTQSGQNAALDLLLLGIPPVLLHLASWNVILVMARRLCTKQPGCGQGCFAWPGVLIAVYGLYAMFRRDIPNYLFMQTQFVFFNFEEPLVFFFLDYLAVMGLFVFAGYYAGKAVRRSPKNSKGTKL